MLNLGVLLQAQLRLIEDAAPDGDFGTDFLVRRIRLLAFGSLTDRISFFVETDQPNLGLNATWDDSMYIQDAFVSFKVAPDGPVWIDAGMLLSPFTRHSMQSAAAFSGFDYHAPLIRFVANSNRIWRDVGIMVRGAAADGLVLFRAGVFNGVEGGSVPVGMGTPPPMVVRNDDDAPRFTGHVRVNLVGKEDPLFFPGINFVTEPLISVGFGADYQSDAAVHALRAHDYSALAADVYVDMPIGDDQEFVFQTTAFRYDHGENAPNSGVGFFSEAGYRVGMIQPYAAVEVFNSEPDDDADHRAYHAGVAWFLERHKYNLRLHGMTERRRSAPGMPVDDDDEYTQTAILQVQLFF